MEIKRLPLLAAAIGFALMTGCKADPDYDLDRFESTVTIGKNVTFPVGNIKEITVKDLFGQHADADDFLRADYNGNYSLVFSGRSSWNAFRVERMEFSFPGISVYDIRDSRVDPGIVVEKGITAKAMQALLGDFQSFQYNTPVSISIRSDFPELVESVESADVDFFVRCYVNYSFPFNKVTLLPGSAFTYPDWLVVDSVDPAFTLDAGSNSVAVKNGIEVYYNEGLSFTMHVCGLKGVSFSENEYGETVIEGEIRADGKVRLEAADFLYMQGGVVSETTDIREIRTLSSFDSDEINILQASVAINEDVLNERFAGDAYEQDWDLPAFLNDADTDIEFTDLKLDVDVDNGLSSGIGLTTSLYTEPDTQWNPSYTFEIASGKSSFSLSEKEIPGLNGILSPIPTAFGINVDQIHLYDAVVVEPEKDYDISVSTFVQAPLAFSAGSHFEFADTLRQLGVYAPLAEAEISLTAVNTLPLDIELSAEAVDWEGKTLRDIAVTISPSAISGGSLQSAGRTPLTFNIKNTSGKEKIEFDAIKLKLGLRCGSGQVGIQLNEKQGLAFEDVKIRLPQGITTE